jgi:hypothetical protein
LPWPLLVALAASVSPADQATGDLTSYIIGYGPLGVAVVVLAALAYKGWRLISPAREAEIRTAVRDDARGDLVDQVARLERQVAQLQEQRDEALKFTQSNLVPLLVNFTSATSALIPLLQEVVRNQEGGGPSELRRRR